MRWVILGATSAIAEAFAHCVAQKGDSLLLVGRDNAALAIIQADLHIRYRIDCTSLQCDFSNNINELLEILKKDEAELALFIATSHSVPNSELTTASLQNIITVNITHISQIIQLYFSRQQIEHRIIFLSSVAACRGRAKNSFYGGSKAAIERYLQGLQQSAAVSQHITIARLGFIDTVQTYGLPGVFYAAAPTACAKALWKASYAGKHLCYYPFFWRIIMGLIGWLPFRIYRKLRF